MAEDGSPDIQQDSDAEDKLDKLNDNSSEESSDKEENSDSENDLIKDQAISDDENDTSKEQINSNDEESRDQENSDGDKETSNDHYESDVDNEVSRDQESYDTDNEVSREQDSDEDNEVSRDYENSEGKSKRNRDVSDDEDEVSREKDSSEGEDDVSKDRISDGEDETREDKDKGSSEEESKERDEEEYDEDQNAEKGAQEDQEAHEESGELPELSSDSEDESSNRPKLGDDIMYDFDIMMQRKKEESRRSRKRKNIDIINDNDDIIADIIMQMKQAADDDFELNKNHKAATRKLKLLPVVETQLRKIDLREAFLDAGVLGVITDWLTPLPDRSLPNLHVRSTVLKLLGEFNIVDVERLKASGIGKAVMYLYKHPKETKENKKKAGILISNWSRPIFSCHTDFHLMTKEEREQRDFEHMAKVSEKRFRSESANSSISSTPGSSKKTSSEDKPLKPGDKGWVPRARVPAPSTKDYVIRPKSNVEIESSRGGNKKCITRLDKHMRKFREMKKQMKTQRAVPISIEGRKMRL